MSASKNISFFKDCRAMALVEFGLALPVLLILLLGTVEFGRYTVLNQKLDKAAHTVADLVTQERTICRSDLNDLNNAVSQIMKPFSFDGAVTYNSVIGSYEYNPVPICQAMGNVPCVAWQHPRVPAYGSLVGTPGGPATMPSGYVIDPMDNIIVIELYYNYQPMLPGTRNILNAFLPQRLYKATVYKPRQTGGLTTVCEG